MLIAAAAQGRTLDSRIAENYDESSHLLVVETDTMEIVELCEKEDVLGMSFLVPLEKHWCEAIVCGKIPREIFPQIADLGISRYNGAGLTVEEGIRGTEDNSLPMMIKE